MVDVRILIRKALHGQRRILGVKKSCCPPVTCLIIALVCVLIQDGATNDSLSVAVSKIFLVFVNFLCFSCPSFTAVGRNFEASRIGRTFVIELESLF